MTSDLAYAALHGRGWSSLRAGWSGRARLWGATLGLLLAGQAWASQVVVLAQPQVPQYGQVLAGIRAVRAGDEVVDLADEAAVARALEAKPELVIAVGSKAYELAQAKAAGAVVIATAVLGADAKGRKDVTAVPLSPRGLDAVSAIQALAPSATRIAAFYPAGLPAPILVQAQYAARTSGRTVDFLPVGELDAFEGAFEAALKDYQAVWLLTDARLATPERVAFMVRRALEKKVLLVGFLSGMAQAGAAAAVSADYAAIGRETGRFATELLALPRASREGAPFRFAKGALWVNATTLKALELGGALPVGAEVVR
jgi:ABC-type uncharacterized transport system substrate-binding protein